MFWIFIKMSTVWLLLVCLAVCLPTGLGDVTQIGKCSDIPAVQNFKPEDPLGEWFMRGSIGVSNYIGCGEETYTYNPTTKFIDIKIEYLESPNTTVYTTTLGNATFTDPSKHEGRLNKILRPKGGELVITYIYLAQDRGNFIVTLICSDAFKPPLRQTFILTRVKDLEKDLIYKKSLDKKISSALKTLGLKRTQFKCINQDNCPKLPDN